MTIPVYKVDACAYGNYAHGVYRAAFQSLGEERGLLQLKGSAARSALHDMIDRELAVGYHQSCAGDPEKSLVSRHTEDIYIILLHIYRQHAADLCAVRYEAYAMAAAHLSDAPERKQLTCYVAAQSTDNGSCFWRDEPFKVHHGNIVIGVHLGNAVGKSPLCHFINRACNGVML